MSQEAKGWVRKSIEASGKTTTHEASEDTSSRALAGFGTFIEQGVEFEGTLRINGPFRIDCEFRGEIISEDKVIVGEGAGIQADIHAREVVISGAVVGNVYASRQMTLRANGRLHGDVDTPSLEVEKGAVFNGRTNMVRPEVAARAGKPVTPNVAAPSNLDAGSPAPQPSAR